MWVLVPQAVAGKLLGALRKPLSSLWASLAPLLLWLRATLWLAAADPAQRQPAGGEPRGTGEEEEEDGSGDGPLTPTSVNYHFTRQCNYKCGFCFHTAKTSFVLPLDEAKRGLRLLKDAGQYLDILAISCDSFNEDVNVLIGRGQGKINHVENLHKLRRWCRDYRVAFKVNSVINRFNVDEDMREHIKELSPVRWKVFQCLIIEGENSGDGALREAERFVISKEEFQEFLDRHKEVSCLVPECNDKMKDSYLILDEYMRFLNCRKGRKDPSKSILDVGVDEAIKFSGFDEKAFLTRGGKYVWSKADLKLDW
ncbi:radical S-adenosyl methionine domain-containing protein 2 isoform X2 [Molossus molossus]|uniref:radical S-adenosyl methionine domain-containing protein 2 isoform X2 n=1 Tax=Molossus molossus TaxID=27622 RepID=UPI0017464DD7|nr:radical S-adenosyl methionine domain-containing protein 2 isoform X2 [Molossus molossus]